MIDRQKILDILESYKKETSSIILDQVYDSRNTVGDPMHTIYSDSDITIDVCDRMGYYEIFGLPFDMYISIKREFETKHRFGK